MSRRLASVHAEADDSPGLLLWQARLPLFGEALPAVTTIVDDLDLPPDYRYEFLGEAKLLADSNASMASFV